MFWRKKKQDEAYGLDVRVGLDEVQAEADTFEVLCNEYEAALEEIAALPPRSRRAQEIARDALYGDDE